MSKHVKVAVILSGCGVFDGAEIHESVLTLLYLDELGVSYDVLAPNIQQMHVINHLSGEEDTTVQRNVLQEAARIARGKILDLAEVSADDYAAAIVPGGFGAAKNLSTFATKGAACEIQPTFKSFIAHMHAQQKPLGFICIAPALLPKILNKALTLTIGNDKETASEVENMGGKHIECAVGDIVVDEAARVVTTPAYMLAQSISEAAGGIKKLVGKIHSMLG